MAMGNVLVLLWSNIQSKILTPQGAQDTLVQQSETDKNGFNIQVTWRGMNFKSKWIQEC